MPETSQTLRDLISGFNSMQAQLGLTPMSGQSGFMALPTPPPVKHPGQASQEAAQLATRQTQETVQAVAQVRQLAAPGILGLRPAAVPDASGAAGAYASQYRERMQSIESGYLSPYQAQTTANMLGQPGFSGLPSPVFRTAPSMGIFRPSMAVPPPIQLARDQPMIRTPFTPALPSPMFQQPWQQDYQQAALSDERMFASTMAAMPTAAYVGAGALTTGIGGRLGGRFGTAGRIGGLALGAAAGFGLVGRGAEMGMEHGLVQPVMNVRAAGRQLEQMSQQFVVGGSDLNPVTGQGLAPRAAMRVANQMQQDVSAGRTGGFNMRDMMRIGGMAADAGMLDMAQSEQQVGQQLRNVARGLQAFMRLANEPDVKRAMQQMATFRSMGLTVPETNMAMANSTTFARMAGVSTQTLAATAGAPGAMTFQQLGMTAGLGFQVGGAAAGLGQQAIAGGAFNPAQLAMAGGRSGVTQTLTEAAGAGLGVDFPILAALSRGRGGQLTIDPGRVKQIMSGKMSLSEQAQMGAENVNKLGGDSVIMELHTRMNELRDQLGRQLGPQGSVMYAMKQATNLMAQVPGMSFGGALSHLGMSPQQARTVELMGSSPQFWQNLRQQQDVTIRQLREEERGRRERQLEASSLGGRIKTAWNEWRGPLDQMREGLRGAASDVSQWFTERGESARAAEQGATYAPVHRDLAVTNRRVQDAVNRFTRSGGQARYDAGLTRAMGRLQGPTPTTGETLGGVWNTALSIGTGVASVYGGALGGFAADTVAGQIRSNAPMESQYVQALQAQGGITGTLAGAMPGLAVLGGNKYTAAIADYQARSAARVGEGLRAGAGLTGQEAVATQTHLRSVATEMSRAAGKSLGKGDLHQLAVSGALKVFRQKTGITKWGHEAPSENAIKEGMVDSLTAGGMDRDVAARYVTSTWEHGLKQTVLRSAQRQATDAERGAITQALEARGYTEATSGRTIQEVEGKIAELEKGLVFNELGAGDIGWMRVGVSKKAEESYKEHLMTRSTEEMLYLQSQALGADSEQGKAIQSRLREKLGEEGFSKLREGLESIQLKGDEKKAFTEAGKRSAARGEGMFAGTSAAKDFLLGGRGRSQAMRGIGALSGALQETFGGIIERGAAGAESTLQRLMTDTDASRALEKESPELAKLAAQYKEASGEKRADIAQQFYAQIQKRGAGATKSRFGGAGAGGDAEGALREQQGVQESIQASIDAGKPQEAFAQAVPVLAKASERLDKSAENLEKVTRAAALMFKMPWGL